ncbi:MAG: hypothetical protein PWR01_223, partial [Clostridiales bacterium]|nr:hypothetical protein [Clostridiales bacterium]
MAIVEHLDAGELEGLKEHVKKTVKNKQLRKK